MLFSACGLNQVSGSYKWLALGTLQGALECPKPCIISYVHPNDAIQLNVHVSVTSVCKDPIRFLMTGTVNLKCEGKTSSVRETDAQKRNCWLILNPPSSRISLMGRREGGRGRGSIDKRRVGGRKRERHGGIRERKGCRTETESMG